MSNQTGLEKQLGTIFEATLEQKAVDKALEVWESKFSIENSIKEEDVAECVDNALRSTSCYNLTGQDSYAVRLHQALFRELMAVVKTDILNEVSSAFKQLIKTEFKPQLRALTKEVIADLFKEKGD